MDDGRPLCGLLQTVMLQNFCTLYFFGRCQFWKWLIFVLFISGCDHKKRLQDEYESYRDFAQAYMDIDDISTPVELSIIINRLSSDHASIIKKHLVKYNREYGPWLAEFEHDGSTIILYKDGSVHMK